MAGRPARKLVGTQACSDEDRGHGGAEVDKETLRRKPCTDLVTAVCKGPQYRKGPLPAHIIRSQTVRQRAEQGTGVTRNLFVLICSTLYFTSPTDQADQYRPSGLVPATEDKGWLSGTAGKPSRAGLPG